MILLISWGISPPGNGSVKSVDLLNQSINRKDGINWGVFIKKDLEAIGGADLVVAEVTDENIAIGYQIAVAVQQKKPVLMLIAMTYRLSASLATSTLTLINLLLLKGTT